MDCLADPDPELRHGIAFEALSQWMRTGDFDAVALRGLRDRPYLLLDGAEGKGYARPFAALVLSEVARTDRVQPWMSAGERTAMCGVVRPTPSERGDWSCRSWSVRFNSRVYMFQR